jgi:replicative DNA helicase
MENKRMTRKHSTSKSDQAIFNAGRVPPQCVEVEQTLLSCAINAPEACIDVIIRKCKDEMFYKENHQIIFKALQQLFYDGTGIDIFLLIEQLRKMQMLEQVGGFYAITELSNVSFSPANTEYHILILWQYYLKRKICELATSYADKTFDESIDSLDLLGDLRNDLDEIQALIESSKTVTITNVVDDALDNILQRATGQKASFYKCGYPKLDELLRIDENKIILIGGAAKHMKTRFLISIIMGLLNTYEENLAIDWYCLEDGTEALVKSILSHLTYMDVDEIDSVKQKISSDKMALLESWSKRIRNWDIEYKEEPKHIKYITAEFTSFVKKRPDKLCILILDNALLITNMMKDDDKDDKFMNELARIRQLTKGLIFVVHHFNSEQQNKDNLKNAYRPSLNHLKGREAYRRIPNVICLINKPGMYPDLIPEYVGMQDIFEHLFLVDVAANRGGKAAQDELTLLRFWTIPEYSRFQEIDV